MNQRLETLQFFGLITKFIMIAFSLVQSVIVIRLLSPQEYGFIGLVLAFAGIVGVYQHLGLGVGTLREVSLARDEQEASKIFFTSLSVRMLITLPLVFGLLLFSSYITNTIYHRPEILFGTRLVAFTILFNGIMEIVFNVLNGLQKFKQVFILQILNSAVSMLVVVPFVFFLKYDGYFIGSLITVILFLLIYVLSLLKVFGFRLLVPNKSEFKKIFRAVFGIGIFIYIAKILYGLFMQSGILILGYYSTPDTVGYLKFAIGYGFYLLSFSNAVNYINLPVMSKRFAENVVFFKESFKDNFDKFFSLTLFAAGLMVLFSKEAILILAGRNYLPAQPLIFFSVLAFFFLMIFEILSGCIFLPSSDTRGYVSSYSISAVASLGAAFFLVSRGGGATGAIAAMFLGAALTFVFAIFRISQKLSIMVADGKILIMSLVCLPLLLGGLVNMSLYERLALLALSLLLFWFFTKYLGILNLIQVLSRATNMLKSRVIGWRTQEIG
ncbi:hypothetical protein HKBW3S09_00550 [Candidatus Hakubella thermalkaliphila]|uniref:Polysaccharide biosynthesis protein C-terminal domain-containing protein n=4 Tax=Candidatus Hakubella thermalkaliphila TaxID=2754717 RepID=A0A6V8Q2F3_9ACTN|nr:oligosaccharide flippase family protein [Candidatus Hakubella thermalkaliphila]GFP23083.1 hypothetical protein HKBW3S09_00550 [Candidatus Hakubella thermalkaliphila]GFP38925.1 hypothetical protein HKBW3S47_00625 [Candidatus Hakubella thermalkaliphila]